VKRLSFILILILFMIVNCAQDTGEKFSYEPKFPQPGENISIRFNAKNTPLAKSHDAKMVVYEFIDNVPRAKEVDMLKRGRSWVAKFVPDTAVKVLSLKFETDEYSDDNDKTGYHILMYNNDKEVVAGGYAMLAHIQNSGAFPLRLDRNPELAMETLQKELSAYPESSDSYRDLKWSILKNSDDEESIKSILSDLHEISESPNITLDEKKLLATWFGQLGLVAETMKYEAAVLEAEPDGELAEDKLYSGFAMEQDLEGKLKRFREFQKRFPESDNLERMTSMVIDALMEERQYDRAEAFLKSVTNSANHFHYNQLAWSLGESGLNLDTANQLAQRAVDLARAEIAQSPEGKPSYVTNSRWNENLRRTLGNILDTRGYISFKMENYEEAVPVMREAVELTNYESGEINERYANALVNAEYDDEAYKFLEKLVKDNKRSPLIDNLYRDSYVNKHGSADGLDEIFHEAKNKSLIRLENELKNTMVNKPAPDFHLNDLNGETITLHDLEGKVVVLDFWATWCGPCVRSMPAMQKFVEKYKDDDKVEIFFVNSWERGNDKQQKVREFLADRGLDLHVLMDEENHAIHDYKVEGIPTKFVIDGKGHIRFKSVGFRGDEEHLITELTTMINLVQ